jgi:hypothetical protein
MNETQDTFAPYAPTENVLRVLNKARAGGLRGAIDTAFLIQLGINDSMAPRTIRALHFLGFIQADGNPTPHLAEYVQASDEQAQTLLKQAIVRSYAMVLRAVDPETDPRSKIFNAFRTMRPQGQWDRMVTLFLGLCRAAGMDVKEAPVARPGRLDGPREQRVQRRPTWRGAEHVAPPRSLIGARAPQRMAPDTSFISHAQSLGSLDPSLVAFLEKLQEIGSIDDLDVWFQTFRTLFAYVLARKPQSALTEEKDENQATT